MLLCATVALFSLLPSVAQAQETAGICDRTEAVQRALLSQIWPRGTACSTVTSAQLRAITLLIITGETSLSLDADDFSGLTGLRFLIFRNNGTITLPSGVFARLIDLGWLSFNSSSLPTLSSGVFEGLSGLEGLALIGNSLPTLSSGIFDELTGLETLSIKHSSITTLPSGVFAGLSSLEELDLRNNSLPTLSSGVFAGLTGLETLRLNNSNITTLSSGVFAGLSGLETLNLYDNDITTLSSGVFAGLTGLETLNLYDNNITTLSSGVFAGLTGLETLRLDSNDITALSSDTFTGLTNLDLLYLNSNDITTLSSGVFAGLTRLRDLSLGDNRITTLRPGVFAELTRLEALRFYGNSIATLPSGVFDDLTALTYLNLVGNRITTLSPRMFDALSALRYLDLRDNGITTLPRDLFANVGSQRLNIFRLEGNPGVPFVIPLRYERTDNKDFRAPGPTATINISSPLSPSLVPANSVRARLALNGGQLSAPSTVALDTPFTVTQAGGVPSVLSLTLAASPPARDGWVIGVPSDISIFPESGGNSQPTVAPITVAPTIRGTTTVPQTLTVATDSIADIDRLGGFSYQWQRSTDASFTRPVDISGATSDTYVLDDADVGKYLRVLVSFTDRRSIDEVLTSVPTAQISARPTAGICGRTEAVQRALLSKIRLRGTVSGCSTVTSTQLRTITILSIGGETSLSLATDDFAGLTKLRELFLAENGLTTLPSGIFAGLTGLVSLNLYGNSLTTLPSGIFIELTQLRRLVLSSNEINLSDGIFAGLTVLRELSLGRNNITTLPSGIFAGLTKLEELHLGGNNITALPSGIFAGLTKLRQLTLSYNSITTLPSGVFAGLTRLEELLLHSNSIATLPSGTFTGLTQLKELTLGSNGIATLPSGIFTGLTELWQLSFRGNNITTLPSGVFAGLAALRKLYIDSNGITNLPSGTFAGLTELRELYLGANNITNLPSGTFAGLTQLRKLTLSYNSITNPPVGIFDDLSALTNLELVSNRITALPEGLFINLKNLNRLDLLRNPGAPFTIPLRYERTDNSDFRAPGPTATIKISSPLSSSLVPPDSVRARLALIGGELSARFTVALDTPFTVTQDGSLPSELTMTLAASPPARDGWVIGLPDDIAIFPESEGNSQPTGTLAIDGTTTVPQALTAVTDSIADEDGLGDFSYQWQRSSDEAFSRTPIDITGATSTTYVLTDADAGKYLRVVVSFTDGRDTDEVLTSAATVSIVARPTAGICGRAEAIQHALLAAIGLHISTHCSVVTSAQLSRVTTLLVNHGGLTALTAADLAGLTGLKSLDVGRNAITSLPVGLFAGLPELKNLYFYANDITELSVGLFAGLTKLELLSFNHNAITKLPVGLFAGLTKLELLSFENNDIAELPVGLFAGLNELRYLRVNDNSLTELQAGLFAGLTKLETLYLQGYSFPTLPAGIFAGLNSLSELYLSGAGYSIPTELPAGLFAGLNSLSKLYLFSRGLSELPAGLFDGLTALNLLSLSDNPLSSLTGRHFRDLTGLVTLSLHGSLGRSDELPSDLFAHTTRLEFLGIGYSAISSFPADLFEPLGHLKELDLSHNPWLSSLAATQFQTNTALNILRLNNSGYTSLPDGLFASLANLTELSTLDLFSTPGAPYTIPLRYERTDTGDFGAPGPTATINLPSPLSSFLLPSNAITANLVLDSGQLSVATTTLGTPFEVTQAGSGPSVLSLTLAASPPAGNGWVIGVPDDITIFPESEGNSQPTGTIAIDGTTTVPQTLTAITDSIADTDGLGDFSYQWQRSTDADFTSSVGIGEATSSTYALDDADAGMYIRVVVSFTDGRDTDEVLTSAVTAQIAARLPVGICERTEAVQRALLVAIGRAAVCSTVTSVQLGAISWLTITEEASLSLAVGDFAGLTGLTHLDLNGNGITTLPSGVFADLTQLNRLHLNDNVITTLPSGIFAELTELEALHLRENSITELPSDIFAGLTKLDLLDLYNNDITALPSGVFTGLTELETLHLRENSVTELPSDIFAGLTKLDLLDLDNNDITALPSGVFTGLTELRALRLGYNSITTLPDGIFAGLADLRTLDLRRNDITGLPDGIFENLTDLRVLSLNGNDITGLADGIFADLTKLRVLSLSNNDITGLSNGIFDELTGLEQLYLQNNEIARLPAGLLASQTNLRTLDLKGNPGTPFTIPLRYERTDSKDFRAPGPTATIKISSPLSSSLVPPDSVRARLALIGGELSARFTVALDTPFTVTQDGSLPSELSMTLVASPPAQDGWRIGVPNDITIFPEPEGNSPATGEITIAGTTTVPQTLTAVTGGIADEDSLGDFSYQWQRSTDAGFTSSADISGATGSTYALDDADAGKYLRVVVSFTDGRDTDEVLTSATTAQISARQVAGICGRTEAVQRALLSKIWPQGTACSAVTSAQLGAITRVTITGETSLSLAVGDFAGLTGLTRLDLNGNGITTLPSGVFADLTQLNRLHLNDNVITTLPSGIFAGLTQLNRLHLNDNAITTLPSGIFAGLTQLNRLHLNDNAITTLPSGIFAGLTQLNRLYLNDNVITTLPSGIFAGLTQLNRLHLNDNAITTLPSGIFAGLTGLTHLKIDGNGITTLPPRVFVGLARLGYLNLTDNSITNLPPEIFAGLTGLENLSFSYNDIISLPPGIFAGLTSLDRLFFTNNDITSLPSGIFAGLAKLTFLTLAYNDIINLPSGIFDGLTALTTLHLNNNNITTLPEGVFASMADLSSLSLYQNLGAPFTIPLRYERTDNSDFRAPGPTATISFSSPLSSSLVPPNSVRARLALDRGQLSASSTVALDTPFTVTQDGSLPSELSMTLVASPPAQDGWRVGVPNDITIFPEPEGNSPATGEITIAGTTTVPQTLTAVTGGIADEDSLGDFSYQWQRSTDAGFTSSADISGATGSTYALDDADAGKYLRVVVSFTDGRDTDEVLTSATTAQISARQVAGICGRTEAVQRALLSKIRPQGTACSAVTSAQLGAITTLRIEGETSLSLAAGDFAGLTRLITLDLFRNTAITLPVGVFAGLTELLNLDLRDNGITTLPSGIFAGLTRLRLLNFRGNDITTLPVGVFAGLTELLNLDLRDNGITTLPSGIFAGLTRLRLLNFRGNDITTLPSGIFAGLTGLENLYLTSNSITTLPLGIFAGLTRLTHLDLEGNGIITLSSGIFAGLTGLLNLDLRGNDITTLPSGIFAGLTRLRNLVLNDNDITTLPSGIFAGLTRLRILRLDGNDLTTLPSGIFAGLAELEMLALSGNGISNLLSGMFAGLTGLRVLLLDGNGITNLSATVFDNLTELEGLILSYNSIITLPSGVFAGLARLRDLYLQDNDIPTLPEGLFANMTNLISLRLDGNPGAPFAIPLRYGRVDNSDFRAPGPTAEIRLSFPLSSSLVPPSSVTASLTLNAGQLSPSSVILGSSFTVTQEGATPAVLSSTLAGNLQPVVPYRSGGWRIVPPSDITIFPEGNRPATGEITISGTTTVPQTLTAETDSIADEDGLSSFNYQWQRSTDAGFTSSVNISEATGSTYALDDADAGKYLRVVVSFTDERGADETLTSAATAQITERPNRPATGEITISGTTTVPQTLTAKTGSIADEDGLGSFSYQWQRSTDADFTSSVDISEATGNTYVLDDADAGKYLRVAVSFTDERGADETLTSAVTAQITERPNRPATGEITIAGTTTVPQTLTAETGGIADEDGLGDFSYQWQRSTAADFTNPVEISDATGSTYALDDADAGKYLRVVVSFTDERDADETLTSVVTAQIAERSNRPATGEITIAGTTTVPQTLTAETDSIADEDGLSSFNYQWQRSTDAGFTSSVDINGATSNTYKLDVADDAKYLRVIVSFTDKRGAYEVFISAATARISAQPNRPATGKITIAGTTTVPQLLTAETGSIADEDGLGDFSYQWQRSSDESFTSPVEASDVTGSTYALDDADAGKYLRVVVSFTDKRGADETFTSVATAQIAERPNRPATGKITISGTTTVPQTLTAETDSIADEDGLGSFNYQWQRSTDAGFTSSVNISEATGSTYALDDADAGKYLRVVVSFTDERDADETLTSVVTAQIAERPNRPATGKITISGTTTVPQTLTAETGSIADEDGLGDFSYQWQRSSDESFTSPVETSDVTGSTYALDDADAGKYLRVVVSFTDERDADETLTSVVTAQIAERPNRPATGKITIAGTTTVPQLLTAETGSIADEDGLGDFSYQWQRSSDESFTSPVEASDVTGSTYALDDADAGKYLRVVVSFTDKRGADETFTSVATAQIAERPNRPATGEITISGTTTVPQTLTAETDSIADEDGLGSFNYQWQRSTAADFTNPVEISDATGSTYALDDADAGKYLRVVVSFTDKRGAYEVLTSVATAQITERLNRPATGKIIIAGTSTVPQRLTAETGSVADKDGLGSFIFQWQRSTDADFASPVVNIIEATGSAYALDDADAGKYLRVVVSFTDERGADETLTSVATAQIAERPNRPATGEITIAGTTTVPQTLTAETDSIADEDGLGSFNYQWQRSTDAGFTSSVNISEATGSTYALDDADAGKYLRVVVSFTDERDADETLTSVVTAQIAERPNRPATGKITISGTTTVPQLLTAETGSIADEDGLGSFSYQWQRSTDADFTSAINISNATSNTYALDDADAGKYLRVVVSFTDKRGNEESITSSVTAQISARPNSPATGTITVAGTPTVPQTLSAKAHSIADADNLAEPFAPTYRWQRSTDADFTNPVDISGVTGRTYDLTDADAGQYLRVIVGFADKRGNEESLTSSVTAQISAQPNRPATGTITVDGTPTVPQTLSVKAHNIADADNLAEPFAPTYRWQRSTDADFTNPVDISGVTGRTYDLTDADAGQYLRVIVGFADKRGNEESLTSSVTAQISARPNNPATGTITVDGTPTVPQTLSAKAHNIADADDLAEPFAPTYRWQRSTDADFTNPVDISGVTGRTYDLTDADAGQYLRVIVGFADKRGNEESLTSSVTAQISARPNNPATGTITVDGTPTVPQTLTAKAHNIADADDLAEPFAPTYRWQRSTDAVFTNPVDISEVTGRTYDLTDADAGQYLRVIVGFADKRGNEESLTSSVTAQIAARPNNPATGTITVAGTARVDEKLTVSIDTIADDDGLPESFEPTYQWQRSANADFSGTPTDIPDATGESYILVSADVGNYIRVVVNFTDNLGFSESVASKATEQISAHPNTGATGTPLIAGTPVSGQTLTADASGVSDVDGLGRFSYQWHRGTTPDFTPSERTRMATGQSYELQDEDVGGYALVMVSFTDNKGNVEEMPSLATEQIRAAMFTAHTMKSMTAVTDLSMAIELTRAVKSNIDSPSKGLRIDGQSAGSRLRSALQSLVPRGGAQGYCARNEVSTYDNLLGSSGISAGPCVSLDQEELMLRLRQALEVEDISLGLSGDGSGPNLWLHATAFDVAGSPLIDDSTLGYSDGSGTLAYLGLTLPATDNFKYGFTFGQSNTSLDLALVAGGAQNDGVYRRLSFFSSFLDYRLGNSAEYHVSAVFGVGAGYTDFKVESDSGSDRLTGSAVSSLSFATLNFGREFQLGERSNLTPSFQFTASSSSTEKAILTGDGDDLVMPRVSSEATEFSLNLDATFKSLSGGQQLVIGGAVRSGTGDLEYSGVADLLVRYQSQRFSAQLQQQINGGENERNSYSLEYAVLTPTIDPAALSKLGLTIGTDYSRTIYYGESGDALDVGPLSLGYFGRLNYSFGKKDVAGSGTLGTRLRLNQSGEVSADINFNIDF